MCGIRLNPAINIVHTDAGGLLRSDLDTLQLRGPDAQIFIKEIVPLLDGSRDAESIANAMGRYSRRSVYVFLDRLEKRGILETADAISDERWRGQIEFFRKWTEESGESTERLNRARILLVGLEPWGATAAIELAASGIGALQLLDDGTVRQNDLLSVRLWNGRHLARPRAEALAEVLAEAAPWCRVVAGGLALRGTDGLAFKDTNWDLAIGAGTRDQLQLFHSLARFAHAHNIPSLSGYIDGIEAVVGPAVAPGRTPCWNCTRLRQLATSDHPEVAHALQRSLLNEGSKAGFHTYLAPAAPFLGHLLALEALKLVSHYTPSHLLGRVFVQNLVTLEANFHTVIRMPWCEVCGGSSVGGTWSGGPVLVDPPARVARSRTKPLSEVTDAKELRHLMAGWIDSRTGVVKRLMPISPEAGEPDLPITYVATLSSYTEGRLLPRGAETASGKGLTQVDAMISAVGEAIERYSAARYRANDLRRAALDELGEEALDPRRLCLYDDAQYEEPGFAYARFDPGQPITWTQGWWLDTGATVLVPALLTYFGLPERPGEVFCQVTSNGLAAGVDLKDAAQRAVLELVERDAFMVTWLAQRPGRRLVVDDALDAGTREIIRQLNEVGVKVEILLLDAGLRIPVVACLGLGDGKWWPGVAVGLGAHLEPMAATRKAILELARKGPHVRGLMSERKHRIPRRVDHVRHLTDHALYYVPAHRRRAINFLLNAEEKPLRLSEFEEPEEVPLETCVLRLKAAGVRVAVVDVTSPDVAESPFRVVRAVGVGLQPLDFGFNRRRLATPRLKSMMGDGLNPHPHPLT